MILLIDADSLVFASCCKSKNNKNDNPFYTDINDSVAKFDEQYMKIVNDMQVHYDIEKVITFNGCKGNFRKRITKGVKGEYPLIGNPLS